MKLFNYSFLKYFLIALTNQLSIVLYSQELVLNGKFEKCIGSDLIGSSNRRPISYLIDWNQPVRNWEINYYYETNNILKTNINCKDSTSVKPLSGQGMVELFYCESCPFSPNMFGCASYIYQKLKLPLEVGKVYEITMWVNFSSKHFVESSILENIGFYLSINHMQFTNRNSKLMDIEYFFSDSIICDQWFQIKKYIRALCPLDYLTIGAFKNTKFPKLNRPIDSHINYFVDDVSIREVNEDTLNKNIIPTPFCNYYKKQIEKLDTFEGKEKLVHFEVNKSTLLDEDKLELDSFFVQSERKKKSIYIINGYTDSKGSNNKVLSLNRAHEIRNYLLSKFNVQDFKFICIANSDLYPIASNETYDGRALNRRASILVSNIDLSVGIYRKGLEMIANKNYEQAINNYLLWIKLVPPDSKLSIVFDPRLKDLRNKPSWNKILNELKRQYSKYNQPELSYKLDSLYFEDQKYRDLDFTLLMNSHYLKGVDTFTLSELDFDECKIKSLDSSNLSTISKIIKKYNFPMISEVGRRQAKTVILILIHGEDTTQIDKYIKLIENYCNKGEADWFSYAMLFDRCQFLKGKPQQYGTQFVLTDSVNQVYKLYQFDDIDRVNNRRKKIGLTKINEMNKSHKLIRKSLKDL